MKNRLIQSLAILIMAVFGTVSATAQVDVSPGVARISLAQGDVSTQRGDSGEWAAAVLNAPVVSGDKISTGDNARAEVQLDYANLLRLGDHAQATIADITRNQIQIQIGEGIANYDVLKGSEASAEVDTPNVAIRADRDGSSFRVIVNSNDETEVIVRRGNVEISTPQGSTRVGQGQIITIHGAGDDTAYKVADAPALDDWDSWVNERNDRIENAKSWNHTDRYYTGSEDLDAYGQWKNAPDYGPVWVPAQGPDWAPYRDGRWVWEPYYGWTWVPSEPWGWAPYHYGRWFYYDSAWAWWPGPVYGAAYYRPVWAPAYVSFFGFGGGVGVSVGVGFGSFGWLPLGPGDYCHPWWGGNRNNYNVVNITNVTNIYNNRGGEWGGLSPLRRGGVSNVRLVGTNVRVRSGVSSLPAGSFGTGRVTARPVDTAAFRNGHLMTGNLPVVPSRESLSPSNRPASVSTIRGGQQHFFGKARSGAVQPFDHQATQVQQSIQNNSRFSPVRSGETLRASNNVPSTIRPTESNLPRGNSANPVAKPSAGLSGNRNAGFSNDGFTRFGSPQAQNRDGQNGVKPDQPRSGSQSSFGGRNNVPRPPQSGQNELRPANPDQSGWHRFSDSGSQRSNTGFGNSGSQRGNGSFGNSASPRGNTGFGNSGSRNVPRPPSSSSASPFGGRSGSISRQPDRYTRPSSNGGDYRSFGSSRAAEPPSRGSFGRTSEPGSFPSRSAQPSYSGGSQYNRFPSSRGAAPSYEGRGYSSPSYSAPSRGASRPPLDMRQPIVGGRSSGGSSFGGSHGGGGSTSHGSSGSSHGGGSPHSGGRGR